MCGRFALTLPLTAVVEWFSARTETGLDNALKALDRPRYNIRPTETIWAVVSAATGRDAPAREVRPMRWGFLPRWAKAPNDGPPLINARGETAAEKPAFAAACRETRCLIPADGFYEWKAAAGRGKEPYWIRPAAADRVAFAGLWRRWTGPSGDTLETCAIVTCQAEGPLAALHDRLPVSVPPEAYGLWLGEEGPGAARLMRAPGDDFWRFHRVSTAINTGGRNAPDGPELRAPVSGDAADGERSQEGGADGGADAAAASERPAQPRLL